MKDNTLNKAIMPIILGMLIGSIITVAALQFIVTNNKQTMTEVVVEDKKPLYWVAPMDANYRKDKPGKSPMGMDLVPVYNKSGTSEIENPGAIKISSAVINNLGVRTEKARFKELKTTINTVGYVTYDEDKVIHIHPRVQGWIEKLYIKAGGELVTEGQALYDIYSPEFVNAQKEFILVLGGQNKQLINAAVNRLYALKFSKRTIEKLKKTKEVQQAITFYAPQNGVVENLNIREGFYVEPSSTLMSISDLSSIWVEAEVFERQVTQVSVGALVTMTLDYLPGKQWQGEVAYVYPTLDAKTRTLKVRLRFKNEKNAFKPNMFAQVEIHNNTGKTALVIPKEALIRTGKQDRVVLALGEGRFKSIAVTVGNFSNEYVEVLSGLAEGDNVVSSAQFLLDSESSKLSDFKRMTDDVHESMSVIAHQQNKEVSSATATGTINSIMLNHGMINISRSAIAKWQRPAAVVDFSTDKRVDLAAFSAGMEVKFTFEVRDNNFVIVEMSQLSQNDNMHHSLMKHASHTNHEKNQGSK